MGKEFLCPKCRSQRVTVTLKDGTTLKSLGSKLAVERPVSNARVLDFEGAVTSCFDCNFQFMPKCLAKDDIA